MNSRPVQTAAARARAARGDGRECLPAVGGRVVGRARRASPWPAAHRRGCRRCRRPRTSSGSPSTPAPFLRGGDRRTGRRRRATTGWRRRPRRGPGRRRGPCCRCRRRRIPTPRCTRSASEVPARPRPATSGWPQDRRERCQRRERAFSPSPRRGPRRRAPRRPAHRPAARSPRQRRGRQRCPLVVGGVVGGAVGQGRRVLPGGGRGAAPDDETLPGPPARAP